MDSSRRRRSVVGLILGLLAALAAGQVSAGTYYWDANGTAAGAGDAPGGIWGSSPYWSTSLAGTASTTAYTTTSSDNLYFVAGPGATSGEDSFTVSVSGSQNANSLTFQSSGAPTLGGTGTINLWSGGVTVSQYAYGSTPPAAVTISAPVSLQASQTWTNNSINLLTIGGNVANGANTLTIAGSGNTTVSGIIGNGSGALVMSGSGTLTLSGTANSYTGGTTVNTGTLVVTNSGALAGYNTASKLLVWGNGTLSLLVDGSSHWTATEISNLLSANGSGFQMGSTLGLDTTLAGTAGFTDSSAITGSSIRLAKLGSNTLTLSATNNTYGNGTIVSAGTLAVTNTGALPNFGTSGKVTVGNGATLALSVSGSTGWTAANVGSLVTNNSAGFASGAALGFDTTNGNFSYGSALVGNMGVTKLGSNTLTLSATNSTYTGTTTVSAGTLVVTNTGAMPSYSAASGVIVGGNGTLTLNVGGSGWTATALGTLLGANSGGFSPGSVLGIDTSNGSLSYGSPIAGSMGLTKQGSNTFTLTAANSFTGPTTITGGTLDLCNGNALQQSTLTAPTTGSLVLDQTVTSHAFTFGGLSDGGGISLADNGGTPITVTVGGNNASTTYSGVLSGSGSLVKVGAGTLTLSGTNTFSGTTTITAGVLDLSNSAALAQSTLSAPTTGSLVFDSTVSGRAFTLGGLSDGGSIGLLSSAGSSISLTVGGNNSSTTYSGVLSGSGSFTKTGTGTLTLTGINTYSGGTTINGGAVKLGDGTSGDDGLLPSAGGITLANSAGLIFNPYGLQTCAGAISGTGSLTKTGSGLTVLTAANSYTGGTTVTAGTLQLGDGTSGHDGSLSNTGGIADNAALAWNLAGSQTYSGAISGTGSVTKVGTGTLTLSATSNTYSGGTTVNVGTLTVATTGALPNYGTTGKVTVGNGGTLALSSTGWTAAAVGSLLSANSAGFASGSALGFDTTYGSFSYGSGYTPITGNMGLTKLGPNTLTLTGSNTFSGTTTVSSGTLDLAAGNALQQSTLVAPSAGSLVFDSTVTSHAFTLGGLSDGGSITLVNNGSAPIALTVGGNNSNTSYSGSLSGSGGSLTKVGVGTLALLGSNTYTGGTTISAGTLQFGDGTTGHDGSLVATGGIADNAALAWNLAGTQSYAGVIAGTGSLTKSGSGTLILQGANIFSGATTITGGVVNLSNSAALQLSTVSVPAGSLVFDQSVSGGTFTLGGLSDGGSISLQNNASSPAPITVTAGGNGGSTTYSGVLSGSGSFIKAGTGTLTFVGSNTYTGGTTVNSGTLQFGDGTRGHDGSLSNTGGINNNAALLYNLFGLSTYSGNISGSGNLTKSGTGTLTLSGTNNTYTGGTTITAGILEATNTGALAGYATSGKVTVTSSGMLSLLTDGSSCWTAPGVGNLLAANSSGFASGSAIGFDTTNATGGFAYSSAIAGSMGFAKLGTNTLTLTGSNTFTGGTTVSAGTLQLGDGTTTGWVQGGILDNAALAFNPGGSQTYAGAISGTGSLTKSGAGTLTLSGSNTFTGPTTITGGTLDVSSSAGLQGSTVVAPTAGTLVFDSAVGGRAFTFGGLSDGGSISLLNNGGSSITLTVGGNNGSTTYSGALSGSGGSFVKAGTGMLTLIGSNSSYTGGTTVSTGTLQLGDGTSGHDGVLSNTGGITDNAALAWNLAGTQTYSGVIGGSGNLTKTGTGALSLQAASTFSGTTTITGGTLDLCNGNALQQSTLVAPTAGSLVFDSTVSGRAFTFGGLSDGGSIGLLSNAGSAITLTAGGNNGNTTYSGILSGSGSFIKAGSGTLTFIGANTYTGGTTVSAGTLQLGDGTIGDDGSLSNTGGISISNGAVLAYDLAQSETCSCVIGGSGSLTASGPGMLVLTGRNTYTSATIVNVGALKLDFSQSGAPATNILNNTSNSSTLVMAGGTLAINGSANSTNSQQFNGLGVNTGWSAIQLTAATSNPLSLAVGGITRYAGGTVDFTLPTGTQSSTNGITTIASNNSAGILGGWAVAGTDWASVNGSNIVPLASSGYTTLAASGGGTQTTTNFNLTGSLTLTGSVTANSLRLAGSGSSQSFLALGGNNVTLNGPNGGLLYIGGNNFPYVVSGTGTVGAGSANEFIVNTKTGTLSIGAPIVGSGAGILTKAGTGTLILTATSSYTGVTVIGGGLLQLGDGTAGHDGSLATSGIIDNAALTYDLYGSETCSGVISGPGTLTKLGAGTLTLTGANTFSGGTTINGGALIVASSSTLISAGGRYAGGNVWVGNGAPSAMTIQGSASVSVGGELIVNNVGTGPSTLTLTGGSLSVTGVTLIGAAGSNLDPSNINGAFYQSGGTATLNSLVRVGYVGTATSTYDISGGVMTAANGLDLGYVGNGNVNIHGSGSLSVLGSNGLVIGGGGSQATTGALTLSNGTLTVTNAITLGWYGGTATLIRSGGTLVAGGSLVVGGDATLVVDNTTGALASATSFAGTLTQTGPTSTLTVVPFTGNLSTSEAVRFGQAPALTNGILGPWAVVETSGTNSSGEYLTTTGSGPYSLATANYTNGLSGSTGTSVVSVTSSSTLAASTSAYAVKFGPSTTTALSNYTLQITSGGLILNGSSTITGGLLSFADSNGSALVGLIYAGGSTQDTIASPIQTTQGLVKFGPGTLVLSGNNTTLGNAVTVDAGTLSAQSSGALGAANSCAVTVAVGATLALQSTSGIAVGNNITLNGTGVGGSGALANSGGNNSLSGTVTLGSNSQINVSGGSLTLSGAVQGLSYNLTKAGPGTLILAGSSDASFPGVVTVTGGALQLQNNSALGTYGDNVIVGSGAAIQLRGGVTIPGDGVFTLSGVGTGNGALENVQGSNSFAGPIALVADSTVGIDSAADTLTLSGEIDGGYSLSKVGPGTLVLSCSTSGFTGAVKVLQGTLSLPSINNANSTGPLGAGSLPVVLGSDGQTATLLYTGVSATSSRNFTLAASGGGNFQVSGGSVNLTLAGAISGNGSLIASGPGALTLTGADTYTGTTAVTGGTLTLTGSAGSLASPVITVDGTFTISNSSGANNSNRLANNAVVNLVGGTLDFINDGSANSFTETLGLLNITGPNSTVNTGQAGSGGTSTLTLGGISCSPGGTVNFTGTGLGTIRNAVTITGEPTGYIGAWARSGTDWAKYAQIDSTGVYSVMAFASTDYTSHAPSAWVSGDHVKLSGGTTTLSTTGNTTVSSLNLAATSATTLNIADGATLRIDGTSNGGSVGGLLISGSAAATIAASGTNQTGAVTAGLTNQPGELLIQQTSGGTATISAHITNNGSYPLELMLTGPGMLVLTGSNNYTGGTVIAGGVLAAESSSAIPQGSLLCIGPGGSLILGTPGAAELLGMIGGAGPLTSRPVSAGPSLSPQGSLSAVPEPGTLGLLAAGAIGLGVLTIRRRRRFRLPTRRR